MFWRHEFYRRRPCTAEADAPPRTEWTCGASRARRNNLIISSDARIKLLKFHFNAQMCCRANLVYLVNLIQKDYAIVRQHSVCSLQPCWLNTICRNFECERRLIQNYVHSIFTLNCVRNGVWVWMAQGTRSRIHATRFR